MDRCNANSRHASHRVYHGQIYECRSPYTRYFVSRRNQALSRTTRVAQTMEILFNFFLKHKDTGEKPYIMPIVHACMNMSKTKTGALIVIEQGVSLDNYKNTGDTINANVNARLIENIFFKNSPLHDGAMIIADDRIASAACILPVSHNTRIPKSMGLRHRSALGITEVTDALAVVVSEETGNISLAHNGKITTKISGKDLERMLAQESID